MPEFAVLLVSHVNVKGCRRLRELRSVRTRYTGVRLFELIVILLMASAGVAGAGRCDSGIAGSVSLGPLCPAERPGMVCSRPLESTIDVLASDGKRVATAHSAKDGTFKVCLPPGKFTLVPERIKNDTFWPRPIAQEADVAAGRFTQVNVSYDTGIR